MRICTYTLIYSKIVYKNKGGELVMAEEVIIYGRAGCPYTDQAKAAYGENAKYYDVQADSVKLQEMLKLSEGARIVPVIVDGGKVIIGHGGT
jgi:glutaredoxin